MSLAEIRVVLIDDHTLFRKGLSELLEQYGGIKVVGATGNVDEVYQLLRDRKPDLIVMDLNMPVLDGISLFRRLTDQGCNVPTLLLTVSDAEEDLASAVRAGVRGYLLKDMEPDDLVDAIQRAVRGETVVAPAMAMKMVNFLQLGQQPGTREAMLDLLTQREREILGHLAQGQSNKAIARALDISHETVKLHVRHILSKLNLSSRVAAALFAVEHGVLSGNTRN
jgi:two-component system nitrate/nitrite response regulator NarL